MKLEEILFEIVNSTYEPVKAEALAMLRQQQDEITVLKQILSYEGIEVNLNECVEEFRKAQK